MESRPIGKSDYQVLAHNWKVALCLNDIGGLSSSNYLIGLIEKNTNGKISLKEVGKLINDYYTTKEGLSQKPRTAEADKVSCRIVDIIKSPSFSMGINYLTLINKSLFKGIYENAGLFRDNATLESIKQIFYAEEEYSYQNLSQQEQIRHIGTFFANILHIYPFKEGNIQTIAVFAIQFLKSVGFNISTEVLDENAKYLCRSLIIKGELDYQTEIKGNSLYIEKLLCNLFLREHNKLEDCHLYVNKYYLDNCSTQQIYPKSTSKVSAKEPRKIRKKTKDLILKEMKKNPSTTREKLAKIIGITPDGIKKQLEKLKLAGKIQHVGSTKGGHWDVLE